VSSFTINMSELEKKILEEHLLDVQGWIEKAIEGKINQCRKRIVASHTQTLINDPEVASIPATTNGICENLFNSAGYQNRAERDASARPREE
jgi:hypothetical protein